MVAAEQPSSRVGGRPCMVHRIHRAAIVQVYMNDVSHGQTASLRQSKGTHISQEKQFFEYIKSNGHTENQFQVCKNQHETQESAGTTNQRKKQLEISLNQKDIQKTRFKYTKNGRKHGKPASLRHSNNKKREPHRKSYFNLLIVKTKGNTRTYVRTYRKSTSSLSKTNGNPYGKSAQVYENRVAFCTTGNHHRRVFPSRKGMPL